MTNSLYKTGLSDCALILLILLTSHQNFASSIKTEIALILASAQHFAMSSSAFHIDGLFGEKGFTSPIIDAVFCENRERKFSQLPFIPVTSACLAEMIAARWFMDELIIRNT